MAPDGKLAVHVTCPKGLQDCFDEAAEGCPRGYDILNRENTTSVWGARGVIWTQNKTEIWVRCRTRVSQND